MNSTKNYILNKLDAAVFVTDLLRVSPNDWQLTMTTAPEAYGDFYVSIATTESLADTETHRFLKQPQPTSDNPPQAGSYRSQSGVYVLENAETGELERYSKHTGQRVK